MSSDNPSLQTPPTDSSPNPYGSLRRDYERHGFVGPIDILSEQQAKEALSSFEEFVSSFPDEKMTGGARFKPHLYVPFCHSIAHHPELVRLVQELLATEHILLWSSDFNIKEPNTDSWFPPHQDSTYAGLDPPDKVLTVWLAISKQVSQNHGCLSFWKGSHSQGQLSHEEALDSSNMLSRGQRLASDNPNDDAQIVTLPLQGGQATVHNFFTVHQSGPNHSTTTRRIGLALRYMAATVRQTGLVRESVTLVSGKMQHDGFDLEPILPPNPTPNDIRRGKQVHAEAMRREAENYFQGTNQKEYDIGCQTSA